MRVLLIPAVMVGVLAVPGTGTDEPSEADMRSAFEVALAARVQSALAYVAETGGEGALARVRATRTDTFDIRSFTKLDCVPSVARSDQASVETPVPTRDEAPVRAAVQSPGHVCGFAVRVDVVNGLWAHALTGRFYAGPHGLVFEEATPEGA
jgi:hypothetical protein